MPHVSKNKISEKVMSKIKKDLISVISKPVNKKTIIEDIFTETEYIMIAKRLAIIILITKGFSKYRISKNLKVSISTVIRFQKDIDLGRYSNLQKIVNSKQKSDVKIVDVLEKVLLMGMPAYVGKGRWSWLNNLDKK
jgi:uncharacterized protein YerC